MKPLKERPQRERVRVCVCVFARREAGLCETSGKVWHNYVPKPCAFQPIYQSIGGGEVLQSDRTFLRCVLAPIAYEKWKESIK